MCCSLKRGSSNERGAGKKEKHGILRQERAAFHRFLALREELLGCLYCVVIIHFQSCRYRQDLLRVGKVRRRVLKESFQDEWLKP